MKNENINTLMPEMAEFKKLITTTTKCKHCGWVARDYVEAKMILNDNCLRCDKDSDFNNLLVEYHEDQMQLSREMGEYCEL